MKRGSTSFLKVAVYLLGLIILVLSVFWLPWLADLTATMNATFSNLKYPVLVGIYVTTIPFFIALYQTLKLLNYIQDDYAFSDSSVFALRVIKSCAVTISVLYVIGMFYLLINNALHPGLIIIGTTISFSSVAISVFAAVLEKLLINALEIKSENDLTV